MEGILDNTDNTNNTSDVINDIIDNCHNSIDGDEDSIDEDNPVYIRKESLYKIGDLVQVDETKLGYIINHCIQNENANFTVKYIIDKNIKYGVSENCIKVVSFQSNTTTRSGTNRHAPQHPTSNISEDDSNEESDELKEFKKSLNNSFSTSKYTSENPLYQFLLCNRDNDKGWIRDILQQKTADPKTHLLPMERMLLCLIASIFSGYSPCNGYLVGYADLIRHAFGVSSFTHNNILTYFINTSYTMERKKRKDSFRSIFNCEETRKKVFTGYNVYKRNKTLEFRESTEKLSEEEYQKGYDELTDDQKTSYDVLAEQRLDRSRHLWEDLKDILIKTKGRISYREMESQLGNIVNHVSIMNFLKSQEGFTMRKDRIFPSLDLAAKERRVKWAQKWWTFWKCVTSIPTDKALVVNVHMDEKWFYAVRARTNVKELTSIGLENNYSRVHHKNNIEKTMYIVVTAYVLSNGNDITKGGKAIPISCIRCGRMVKAEKDSYKRVYNDDDHTYTYPKIEKNKLKTMGKEYFKNLELTGCSEGTKKDPKCSLLKIYKEQIIKDLEEKVVNRFNQDGKRQVIIVKQEDSAGLHNNTKYCDEMEIEFHKRGWILFRQPSQSPVTNVHDACIFPMMSKNVSSIQATDYHARLLKGEELHEAVMKVWNNKKNTVAMSRAFAGHSQVVCAILAHNGDNTYLREKNGMTFGVRKMFVPDEDGEGVIPIDLAPQTEGETVQGVFLSERNVKNLKYTPPDIRTFGNVELEPAMKELFIAYADVKLMTQEVEEVLLPIMVEEQMNQTLEEIADENAKEKLNEIICLDGTSSVTSQQKPASRKNKRKRSSSQHKKKKSKSNKNEKGKNQNQDAKSHSNTQQSSVERFLQPVFFPTTMISPQFYQM